MLAVLACAALGCAESTLREAGADAGSPAAPRVKPRTVSIEIVKTGERPLSRAADGAVVYGPQVDLGGVEVCVAQRRQAAASFEPFEEIPLEEQICETSVAGQTVRLSGVPASSDLIITLTKDGFMPASMTSRTDEFDVGFPDAWLSSAITPLTAEGALEATWIEPQPAPRAGNGVVAVYAWVVWFGAGLPATVMSFGAETRPQVTAAEDVSVTITRDGRRIAELSSLPPGLYELRFSHPRMGAFPGGAREQYYTVGPGTDRPDVIELSVIADHITEGAAAMGCGAPVQYQQAEDLSTCRLAPIDAGVP